MDRRGRPRTVPIPKRKPGRKRKRHNFKHGKTGTRAYVSWYSMKTRCNNPNAKNYKYYGGRGIKVCQRWSDSFEAFYADMGDPPEGMTIDRINNAGDYEPGNCRWATRKEQANNR